MIRDEHPTKKKIRYTAYNLMLETGVEASSYAEIATRCGVARTLVQKHFPKKEQLVIEAIEDIISSSIAVLTRSKLIGESRRERILRVSQVYLTVFLASEASMRFSSEAIRTNTVPRRLVAMLEDAACDTRSDTESPSFTDAMVKAVGGIEKLALFRLDSGCLPSAGEFAAEQAAAFSVFHEDAEYDAVIEECRSLLLDNKRAESLAEEALALAFGK